MGPKGKLKTRHCCLQVFPLFHDCDCLKKHLKKINKLMLRCLGQHKDTDFGANRSDLRGTSPIWCLGLTYGGGEVAGWNLLWFTGASLFQKDQHELEFGGVTRASRS